MGDPVGIFRAHVARLRRHARGRLAIRRTLTGLFFGLLPGVGLAFAAGTVVLPFSAPAAAALFAAAGAAVGAGSALIVRIDTRRLLLRADEALGSREVISTARELLRTSNGPRGAPTGSVFTEAIVEDAAGLLASAAPVAVLGRLRLPLAPLAALAVLLTAALFAFPVNLRLLFPPRSTAATELAQIGEDLRSQGQKLAEDARPGHLDRTLELSEELAQLGKELAARRIPPDEALDRMSELESELGQEYQLRIQQLPPAAPAGRAGYGPGQPGGPDTGSAVKSAEEGSGGSPSDSQDKSLRDLGDALDRLRQAQRQLGGEPGSRDEAQAPSRQPRGGDQSPGQSGQRDLPGGGLGQPGPSGQDNSSEGSGQGFAGGNESPQGSGGSGVGTLPAPEKRGPASTIEEGAPGPALQAPGGRAEGDSTRLLARTLPEWTGSRLPAETILNQYSRAAESALRQDEVPLKLRQAVKEYFTAIGIDR